MGEFPDRVERNGETGEGRAAHPESWFARPSTPGPAGAEPAPASGGGAVTGGGASSGGGSRSAAGSGSDPRAEVRTGTGTDPRQAPPRAQASSNAAPEAKPAPSGASSAVPPAPGPAAASPAAAAPGTGSTAVSRPEPGSKPGPEAGSKAGPESGAALPPAPAPVPAVAEDPPTTALRVSLDGPTRALRKLPPPPEGPQQPEGFEKPDTERTRAVPAWTPPPPPPPTGPGPTAGPTGDSFPETTSEAMEVLATLNRRPVSPLRRAMKRISLWGGLLCVLLAVLAVVQVLRPLPDPGLRLTASSSFTFDGSTPALAWPASGQATAEVSGLGSLGHTGSDNPVPIASVTKVMTARLILKDHPLKTGEQGPMITVDQQAAQEYQQSQTSGESSAKVTANEQISEYQALQMLLIPSANNIARLLGRWDAGTDAAFVAKMRGEAAALGMSKTTYTDPSGLLGSTRSTANDQLKLAATVMLDPVFQEIVSTPSFVPPGGSVTYNNNDLLGKNGVIGIKTGSSSAALGCLMWAAEQKVGGTTQTVLGVVLSQPAVNGVGYLPMVLANSKKVILSAEAALRTHTVARKGDVVGYVDDGLGGRTPVVASQDVTVVGWGGLSVDVSLVAPSGGIPHSARAGTTVGLLEVGSGPTALKVPVTLGSDLALPSYGSRLTRLG